MFVIVGYLVVVVSVVGGYALAGGHVAALLQPLELLMIGGGALGAFIVSNPAKVLKATFAAMPGALKGSKYTKTRYMQLMAMLYDVLSKARKEGLMSIENDVDAPEDSPLFASYPELTVDHHLMEFITDYLRMMVSGNLNALEIENLMDNEIETHHHEAMIPPHAIQKVADGLPAFGIVAAVMGVVHTMGSVGMPPSELGEMIAHALVGTFLGILLAYGFVAPVRHPARAEAGRVQQGTAVREGHAAGQHAGLRADRLRRVRPQGAVFDRASQLRRARRPREAEE